MTATTIDTATDATALPAEPETGDQPTTESEEALAAEAL